MDNAVAQKPEAPKDRVSFYDHGGRRGILGWITSTDHKKIGLLYLYSMLTFFSIGVILGLLMRIELFARGETIMNAQMYNAVFTLHGVIMIFLFVIPGLAASFGNFFLPLMLGAKDVAFPRLNLFSWWLFISGAILAVTALFTGGGPPDTGWTFYAPYSTTTGTNVSLAVFAAFLIGFSSILTGLNFITTIHRMRAPGMTWFKMPLFVWALYSTAWIQLLATPVVGITLVLVIIDRFFGAGIFDPAKGGDPLLFQHLFWIYSHPAVYVMILPAMGAISEIIPVFSRKPIFGYRAIAFSSLSIAFVGYLVWGHHMFTSGMSDTSKVIFSFLTFLVAIPTGVKIFNWVATLYRGSISLEPPMLYALSFIFIFSIGGLTGLVNGALATDIPVHDTYFVVAHFHYTMFGGVGFAFFAALHYWFPKMSGRMYSKKFATYIWSLLFIGFNMLYFPMFIIGILGFPRRYADNPLQTPLGDKIQHLQHVSALGSWILALGVILMFVNFIRAARCGVKATDNPWGGATLEWTTPSPPPLENFDEIPHVQRGPYDFRGASQR